jgi:predicted nucleic acid-binding protein
VTVFFDTNVLIYSISVDPAEAMKRDRAMALLERADGGLSIQFSRSFTRKRRGRRGRTGCRMTWPPC